MRRLSPLSWVLIVVGLAFLVVGVLYLTTTASNLPSFIPGHVAHVKHAGKHSKRGIAAIVVAVAAFGGVFYNDFRH
jgi:hypothetical protein